MTTDSKSIDTKAFGKIFIVFPCFNEEEGLEQLLSRVANVSRMWGEHQFELVIVNDGSSDHTIHVARSFADRLPIHIIDFKSNQGVATVFNTAFSHILSKADDTDVAITIDSDNTMNPYTILDLLNRIGENDIVIASRFADGGKMVGAGYRAILSHIASWLMKSRVGLRGVTDYSIFFRAYRIPVLRTVSEAYRQKPVEGQGFSCMANLLIRINRSCPEAKFAEVPLVLRYDKKEGGSAIKLGRTIRGYLKLAFSKEN